MAGVPIRSDLPLLTEHTHLALRRDVERLANMRLMKHVNRTKPCVPRNDNSINYCMLPCLLVTNQPMRAPAVTDSKLLDFQPRSSGRKCRSMLRSLLAILWKKLQFMICSSHDLILLLLTTERPNISVTWVCCQRRWLETSRPKS